jgi:hypothetical protein
MVRKTHIDFGENLHQEGQAAGMGKTIGHGSGI